MRCKSCDVDLAPHYSNCPLCGGIAADEEVKIPNVMPAFYPDYTSENKNAQESQDSNYKCVPKYIAILNASLCGVFTLLAVISSNVAFIQTAVMLSLVLSSLIFMFINIFSKQYAMDSISYSLVNILISIVFLLVALVSNVSFLSMFIAFCVSFLALSLPMSFNRPKNAIEKVTAIFFR
ncbi:MAG: hypothetical protein R3Y27_07705 [Clostridia bacterium]